MTPAHRPLATSSRSSLLYSLAATSSVRPCDVQQYMSAHEVQQYCTACGVQQQHVTAGITACHRQMHTRRPLPAAARPVLNQIKTAPDQIRSVKDQIRSHLRSRRAEPQHALQLLGISLQLGAVLAARLHARLDVRLAVAGSSDQAVAASQTCSTVWHGSCTACQHRIRTVHHDPNTKTFLPLPPHPPQYPPTSKRPPPSKTAK